jgi:hypothetical protein
MQPAVIATMPTFPLPPALNATTVTILVMVVVAATKKSLSL